MAKIALVLVFLLAFVLSIQTVVGDDKLSPEQVHEAISAFKDVAQSTSNAIGSTAESVKDTSSSWTDWANDKLRGYSLMSQKESVSSASSPENAPSPAYSSSFGPGPTAAPMV